MLRKIVTEEFGSGGRYHPGEIHALRDYLYEHAMELFGETPEELRKSHFKAEINVFKRLTKVLSPYVLFRDFNDNWEGRIPSIPGGELDLYQHLGHGDEHLEAKFRYLEGSSEDDLDEIRKELEKSGLKLRRKFVYDPSGKCLDELAKVPC